MSNKETSQLEKIAKEQLLVALQNSPVHNGRFRCLITSEIDDKPTPILMVGNAHRQFQDGHVIAVSNPSQNVMERLSAGCGYFRSHLKEIVKGECDEMVHIWVIASGPELRFLKGAAYKTRKPRTTDVEVR